MIKWRHKRTNSTLRLKQFDELLHKSRPSSPQCFLNLLLTHSSFSSSLLPSDQCNLSYNLNESFIRNYLDLKSTQPDENIASKPLSTHSHSIYHDYTDFGQEDKAEELKDWEKNDEIDEIDEKAEEIAQRDCKAQNQEKEKERDIKDQKEEEEQSGTFQFISLFPSFSSLSSFCSSYFASFFQTPYPLIPLSG